MDFIYNINVLEASLKNEQIIIEHGFKHKRLTWNTAYLDGNGNKKNLNVDTMFVFTTQTLKKALKEKNLIQTLERVQKSKRSRIMFALKNKKEINEENHRLFSILKKECEKLGFFDCQTILWNLQLKGIDNYYAYKLKGIVS